MSNTELKTVAERLPVPRDDDRTSAMMEVAVQMGPNGVDALRQLVDMRREEQDRAAKRAFAQAMRAVQEAGVTVVKDRLNTQTNSKYAKYSTIARALKPAYTSAGFSLMFGEGKSEKEGDIRTIVDVMHDDGHTVQRFIDLPPDKAGIKGSVNKTDIHAKGSTFSYAERYLTVMIFCPDAVDDDDDGVAAGAGPNITDKQAADLRALITALPNYNEETDISSFLNWAGVASIEDILVSRYDRCVSAIEDRARGRRK